MIFLERSDQYKIRLFIHFIHPRNIKYISASMYTDITYGEFQPMGVIDIPNVVGYYGSSFNNDLNSGVSLKIGKRVMFDWMYLFSMLIMTYN